MLNRRQAKKAFKKLFAQHTTLQEIAPLDKWEQQGDVLIILAKIKPCVILFLDNKGKDGMLVSSSKDRRLSQIKDLFFYWPTNWWALLFLAVNCPKTH